MPDAGLFLERAERLVNGLESVADAAWAFTRRVVDKHTGVTHKELRLLIARLPAHPNKDLAEAGFVQFGGPAGRVSREKFLSAVSKILARWQNGIIKDLGMVFPNARSFDISLGLFQYRAGGFLLSLRDEVIRLAIRSGNLLGLHVSESIEEGIRKGRAKKAKTAGLISARITGRGLPRNHRSHSRTTTIILRALKGIMDDQEKALLENVLRGLDEMPRKAGNDFYDATSGDTLRDALNELADRFSTKKLSKKRLLLSVQTHIRAMLRRLMMDHDVLAEIPGAIRFVQVPPTRDGDFETATETEVARAYEVEDLPALQRKNKGAAHSLGLFPGDRIVPIPIPESFFEKVKRVTRETQRAYVEKVRRAKSRRS